MTASLAGKVAIVTGGASGLGLGIVQKFVDAGAEVVIADLNDHDGEQLANECGSRACFRHVDVAVAEDVRALAQAAVDRFGGLDVMVNNAGISSKMHKSFLHDDLADFSKVMSVNLLGVMLGTREAARYMAANDGGSIINVASIGGLQAGGGVMTYRASKAAVIHFTKSVATELAPLGVSVNCLAPGGIPTPILASSVLVSARRRSTNSWRKPASKCATIGPSRGTEPPRTWPKLRSTSRRSPARPVLSSPLTVGRRLGGP